MFKLVEIAQLLCEGRAEQHPVAIVQGCLVIFKAFRERVGQWQAAFAQHGGQRFALYFDDSYEFAAALLGAWQAAKCVYLPPDTLPVTLDQLVPHVDGYAGHFADSIEPLSGHTQLQWRVVNSSATALVIYTSGSSGEPLPVPKTLSQLDAEIQSLESCFGAGLDQAQVWATVSHQHIYGLLFRVLWPLAAGRPFAGRRLEYPEEILAALQASEAAILIGSPAHLKRLPSQLAWSQAAPNLRALFSSGGPLPESAWLACQQLLGMAPFEVYGSSETGGMAWRQRQHEQDPSWQALPGVALRVESGCLQVQSRHLSETQWYATNDRAQLADDGLHLLGRIDRIVKVEEKRVSLSAMEAALLASGLLEAVKVLALPGERLAVVAVPNVAGWAMWDRVGKTQLNARLRLALRDVVERAVLPRRWRYVWALPCNSQGKVQQAALAALFDPRRPQARLLEHDGQAALLQLEVSPKSPYFAGHFPGSPILPGVTQLEWAILFGRELFPIKQPFLRMDAIKFQQVITPASVLQLALNFDAEKNALGFKLSSQAGQHASGRIVFGDQA